MPDSSISNLDPITGALVDVDTSPLPIDVPADGRTRKISVKELVSKTKVFTRSETGAVARTLQSKNRDTVSVKDFGALGDGTGRTPSDTGDDITNASWNTWDGNLIKTDGAYSPYWAGVGSPGAFAPPTTTPFDNNDTWDRIGCQLAFWSSAKRVHVPYGDYMINVGNPARYYGPGIGTSFTGLLMMMGQQKEIVGDGKYFSNFYPAEDAAFFAANHPGVLIAYSLFTTYRMGGLPTVIKDVGFIGPTNYDPDNKNLTLMISGSSNGFTWRDVWFAGAEHGLYIGAPSSDCFVQSTVLEFCLGAGVLVESGSDDIHFTRINCGSAFISPARQFGIDAAGVNISVLDSKFYDMGGGALKAKGGVFSGNQVNVAGVSEACVFTDKVTITGNEFVGAASSNAMLRVVKNSNVLSNTFKNASGGVQPSLALGDNSALSATNTTVIGNTFIQEDATVAAGNNAILAPVISGTTTGAATASCLIDDNTFQGRALQSIGLASMGNNTFDGVAGTRSAAAFQKLTSVDGVVSEAVPSSKWDVDVAGKTAISIDDNGTYSLAIGTGLVLIHNVTSGGQGIFAAAGNSTTKIADTPPTNFSVNPADSGVTAFSYDGGTALYIITNKTGGVAQYRVAGIRTSAGT